MLKTSLSWCTVCLSFVSPWQKTSSRFISCRHTCEKPFSKEQSSSEWSNLMWWIIKLIKTACKSVVMRSRAQAPVIVPQEHKIVIRNTLRSCFLYVTRRCLEENLSWIRLMRFACSYARVHCLQISLLMLAHTKEISGKSIQGTATPRQRKALGIITD